MSVCARLQVSKGRHVISLLVPHGGEPEVLLPSVARCLDRSGGSPDWHGATDSRLVHHAASLLLAGVPGLSVERLGDHRFRIRYRLSVETTPCGGFAGYRVYFADARFSPAQINGPFPLAMAVALVTAGPSAGPIPFAGFLPPLRG